jgi:glycosyltransferase involved in cell wall biosynthesis
MRILISKFSSWDLETYYKSEHPEIVAIRNIISHFKTVSFVLVGEGGQKYQIFKAEQNRIVFYNIPSNTKFRYILSFIIKFLLATCIKPSVIISMGTINIIPYGIACALSRCRFIPIITGEIWYDSSRMPKPTGKILSLLMRTVLRRAYTVLAVSQGVKEEIVNNYRINSNNVIVYRYKISNAFNPNVSKELKKVLNPTGKIVLTICRISPQKGLEYLIEAFKEISEKIPDVKLVIKAYSSERNYEEKLLKMIDRYKLWNNIKIIKEMIPYSELPKYFAAADVFVLPSISEGLGLVLLEALATGVPVVASRVGGIPDIIVHEYNGLLVEPRDPKGLAEAIIRILTDDKIKRQLIKGGLATIRAIKENEIENLLSKLIFKDLEAK